jgi:hypothetical protein
MALPARKPSAALPSVMPIADARALFDREARRMIGVSGEEFIRRWSNGEYDDIDDSPEGREISYLVMLLPFGGQDS